MKAEICNNTTNGLALQGLNHNSTCVILCIFGKRFTKLYDAPVGYDSYCFTNNEALCREAEKRGWKYIYINFPLSDDFVESTLQVKYIKFLQFIKEERFSYFTRYKNIIVTDHKLELKSAHIEQFLQKNEKKILLKHHKSQPTIRIWDEVERSMLQERYLRNMPQTINYINLKIKQGYSEYLCMPQCTIILYQHNEPEVKKLVDEIYNDIMQWRMPNDQIVWGLVSQKYTDCIQMISWNKEIPIKWVNPEYKKPKFVLFLGDIIKLFVPYGILKLLRWS